MKQSLKPGISYRLEFLIPEDKTIQHLYPEAPEFHEMPAVFATGFMVGLMEWTCMKVLEPHLDEGEGREVEGALCLDLNRRLAGVGRELRGLDAGSFGLLVLESEGLAALLPTFLLAAGAAGRRTKIEEVASVPAAAGAGSGAEGMGAAWSVQSGASGIPFSATATGSGAESASFGSVSDPGV